MLIKYIKSVLWRVAKRLSYVEDARCLEVKAYRGADKTLARPGRKQSTAIKLLTIASHSKTISTKYTKPTTVSEFWEIGLTRI